MCIIEKNEIQNKVLINNIFSFQVALDIIRNDEDSELQNGGEF